MQNYWILTYFLKKFNERLTLTTRRTTGPWPFFRALSCGISQQKRSLATGVLGQSSDVVCCVIYGSICRLYCIAYNFWNILFYQNESWVIFFWCIYAIIILYIPYHCKGVHIRTRWNFPDKAVLNCQLAYIHLNTRKSLHFQKMWCCWLASSFHLQYLVIHHSRQTCNWAYPCWTTRPHSHNFAFYPPPKHILAHIEFLEQFRFGMWYSHFVKM